MDQNQLKKLLSESALKYIEADTVVGIGSGTTVNCFIEVLATIKHKIDGAIAASVASEKLLKQYGIPVLDLNSVNKIPVYVDSADEATQHRTLLKGGGGAHTREKIIATVATKFLCLIDYQKLVPVLSQKAPVPIEVLPMARSAVARAIVQMDGDPEYRQGFVTDNGNVILDVYNLKLVDPYKLEAEIKRIPGVVDCGIFANRPADILIVAKEDGSIEKLF
jgi:ribose 5-phosphate isomerase A